MAPSLVKALGSAVAVLPALAGATLTSSNNKTYKISEVYDSSNFFDKFDFLSVRSPDDDNELTHKPVPSFLH